MFDVWYKELTEDLSTSKEVEKISQEFSHLVSDIDRVKFVSKLEAVGRFLQRCAPCNAAGKDAKKGRDFRLKGNELFKDKSYSSARNEYTNAIVNCAACNEEGNDLAMAFANRSAALFHLEHYMECLGDIELALRHNYPPSLQYKILERQGKCYMILGEHEAAQSSFKDALQLLNATDLSVDKKNAAARSILHSKSKMAMLNASKTAVKDSNSDVPSIIDCTRNSIFPCATDAFALGVDTAQGRFTFAAKDINAGDVILVEKPYASLLLRVAFHVNCYHCKSLMVAPKPCRQCSTISFCSSKCEQEAWQQYHQYDCQLVNFLEKAGIGMAVLALHMILKTRIETLSATTDSEDGLYNLQSGLDNNGQYVSGDYGTVFHLEGHSKDRSLADLFKRTILAMFLTRCLSTTPYPHLNSSADGVLIASNLLRHIQMLPCNAHEIACHHLCPEIAQSYNVEIGSAIYPTLSLINHSCDPSVVRHCYGELCVLRAIKPIPKGAEITDNYGALYAVTERPQRLMLLRGQYYFNCWCHACEMSWPLYVELSVSEPIFKCVTCGNAIAASDVDTVCIVCTSAWSVTVKHRFTESHLLFKQAMENVLSSGDLSTLPALNRHIDFICRYVMLPWQELNSCQEIVKQCYSMLSNCVKERV